MWAYDSVNRVFYAAHINPSPASPNEWAQNGSDLANALTVRLNCLFVSLQLIEPSTWKDKKAEASRLADQDGSDDSMQTTEHDGAR